MRQTVTLLPQKVNFTENCNCRGFIAVRGNPKVVFGADGMNKHVNPVEKQGSIELVFGIGVLAKLPINGGRMFVTLPTGQASEDDPC